MEDKKMFGLKFKHENDGRYRSLFFNAKVDGDTISVADLDDERNNKTYESYDRGLKGKKRIFDAHKDYISYELSFRALVKGDEFEYDSWTVDIGKTKSITREDLIELLKKEIDSYEEYNKEYELDKLKRIDWETAQYQFRSMYDYAYYEFNDNRYSISELAEMAMEIVKDKSVLEKIIRDFDREDLSTQEFLDEFSEAYSWDNESVVEKIINNRFKNPQKFEIATEIQGPPSLWTEGHGRDFSYQFTPTKKHLTVYAEEGTKFDTKKVYTKDEVKDLMKDKNLMVVYEYGLYNGNITDNVSNITQKEIDQTIKNNITKEMLVQDYKKFMNYYKLLKTEIGLNIKDIKSENNKKIKEYRDEKAEGDKTMKILDCYDYENI